MSKKWVTLLLVVCIGLAGGVGFMRMNADTEGPEIVFTSEAPSVYRSDMSNEELLTGVTATDRKDGDVSSSLTVESVYEIDDSHVAVTYTAKDNSNNITKQKYEMERIHPMPAKLLKIHLLLEKKPIMQILRRQLV